MMNSFSLFEAWIRPALIGLMLSYWGAPKTSAADYVVAVDVSGSMNWSLLGKKAQITPQNPVRIEVARKYLLDYLGSLPDDAHVDLIAFRERKVSEKEVTLKDAATREDAQKWVAGLHPTSEGHTYLWQTFDEVLQRATAYCAASPGSWVSVRVLTDGENNGPTKPNLTLQKVLHKFRNVDGKAMKPDLVLLVSQNSKLIQKLKKEAGDRLNVTNSAFGAAFPPVIKWAPDPIRVKTSVSFFDNSKSTFKSYEWQVDGKTVSDQKTFDHIFEAPGGHAVRLAVIRSDETRDSVTQSIRVSAPNLVADFVAPVDAKEGERIQFIDRSASESEIKSYAWLIDGEAQASTRDLKQALSPGKHEVKHEVTDVTGATKEVSKKIVVSAIPPPAPFTAPAAKIIVWKIGGTVPLDVKFQSEITGDYSSVNWTFGDGQTSTDPNPAHSFSASGTRKVNLTVIARDSSQVPAIASVAIEAKRQWPEWLWLAVNDIALQQWPGWFWLAVNDVALLLAILLIVWAFRPKTIPPQAPETKKTYTDEEGRAFLIVPENFWAIVLATLSIIYLLLVLGFLFRELFELCTGNYKAFLCFLKYQDSSKALLDSPSFRLLAYAMIGGAMGGVVNGIRSFLSWHCEAAGFGPRYIWKYVTYPVLGAALPFFVYALLRGGMGVLSSDIKFNSPSPGSGFVMFGVGVLSGYGARDVCKWLDFQVRNLFAVKPIDATNVIDVPNVIGQTESEAKATIERAGLTMGTIEKDVSLKEVGKVMKQDPQASAKVVPKASISITVGRLVTGTDIRTQIRSSEEVLTNN